jgi:EmrB/QacA subfamily drug resistance transporter
MQQNQALTSSHPHKGIILFIISLALFMEAVDTTIINTAIPVMAQSLKVNVIDLKIALISYLLSLAIFIPISGWIADNFGAKRVFVIALIIFTLCSAWCGIAHSLTELIIARCFQGLGGSLMLPVGRLIVLRTYERHQLVNAMSKVIMVAALGLMTGPVLGGFITHYFSWRWIFWVNIPVGFGAAIAAKYWLKEWQIQKTHSLDLLGFILFGSGLAMFTFALSAFSETTLSDEAALTIMLVSIALLSFYYFHSRKISNPIISVTLFKSRTFLISVLGNLCGRLSFGGMPFLLPLMFQVSMGYPPQISGLLIAPMAIGVLLVKFFTYRFLRLLGYKKLLIVNTFLVALCLWTFILIDAETPMFLIGCLSFIFGLLIAMQYSGMNSLAYAELGSENLSAATSIISALQQIAQSFGVALSALLLRFYSAGPNTMFHLTTSVFHHAFFAMGSITLLATLIFFRLHPGDGQQMLEAPQDKL